MTKSRTDIEFTCGVDVMRHGALVTFTVGVLVELTHENMGVHIGWGVDSIYIAGYCQDGAHQYTKTIPLHKNHRLVTAMEAWLMRKHSAMVNAEIIKTMKRRLR